VPVPDSVRRAFAEAFGVPATVIARAPGRVNLIGEHTDYSGLPVLPTAIDRALLVAAAPDRGGVVEVRSEAFEGTARLARSIPDEGIGAPWHGYLAGALRELAAVAPGHGAQLLITGDLPSGGGLSSSSALTVGVIAALAAAWGAELPPEEVARLATTAERHVGVETGGMDQQAIALARANHALRIDFLPPSIRHVPIPEGLSFVVAFSGQEAPKGGAARDAYNERVVGTRAAAVLLAHHLGFEIEDDPPLLAHVADVDVVDVLVDELPEKASARDAARTAGVDIARLITLTNGEFDPGLTLSVRRAARHVLSEAARVEAAERALLCGDLKGFGALLNESHGSLRDDMRCSTPALDRVCATMRKAGALGARLTGAGFGGYAVAAVPRGMEDAVIAGAIAATGGPAFTVVPSDGLRLL
jgi:galactokinase